MKKKIIMILMMFGLFYLTSCDKKIIMPDIIEVITLAETEQDFINAYESVKESCVAISYVTSSKNECSAGLIYKKENGFYYAVTYKFFDDTYEYNNFKIYVTNNENPINARLVGFDNTNEIAVFKFESEYELATSSFLIDFNSSLGESVISVTSGDSNQYMNMMSTGIISRIQNNKFQHDSSLGLDFYSNLVFDLSGNFLGLTTLQETKTIIGGNSINGYIYGKVEGIGIAIKGSILSVIAEDIENDGIISRKKLGVRCEECDSVYYDGLPFDMYSLVRVTEVMSTSPFKNFLYTDDIIYEINGKEVFTTITITETLELINIDETVTVKVYRRLNGEYISYTYTK